MTNGEVWARYNIKRVANSRAQYRVTWHLWLCEAARLGIDAILARDGTHRDCPGCRGRGK